MCGVSRANARTEKKGGWLFYDMAGVVTNVRSSESLPHNSTMVAIVVVMLVALMVVVVAGVIQVDGCYGCNSRRLRDPCHSSRGLLLLLSSLHGQHVLS